MPVDVIFLEENARTTLYRATLTHIPRRGDFVVFDAKKHLVTDIEYHLSKIGMGGDSTSVRIGVRPLVE
jgi:hypothetical protein